MEELTKWPERIVCSTKKAMFIACLVFLVMLIGHLYVSDMYESRLGEFAPFRVSTWDKSGTVSKTSLSTSFLMEHRNRNRNQSPKRSALAPIRDDRDPLHGLQVQKRLPDQLDSESHATYRSNSITWPYSSTNQLSASSATAPSVDRSPVYYLGDGSFKRVFFGKQLLRDSSIFKSSRNTSKLSFREKVELWKKAVPYKPEDVDLLSVDPPSFLESYKNPCWRETFHSNYTESFYTTRSDIRSQLERMTHIIQERRDRGDFHRIRCLPYFMIIGQPKSGSTDLYRKLIAHPDVSNISPRLKEPHWWTRTRLGRQNARGQLVSAEGYTDIYDYAAYRIEQETIQDRTGARIHHMITGEASMSTFWDNFHWWAMVGNENSTEPRVLIQHYVRHLLPDVRLVLILRNPTDRLYSDFLYFRKDRKSGEDFHTAVTRTVGLYENCMRTRTVRACVYDSFLKIRGQIRLYLGLYAVFLRDWLEVFPRQQLFVIRTEDYAQDPKTILRQLYSFLGLKKLPPDAEDTIVSMKKANTRRKEDLEYGDMLPETRVLLDKFYQPFNQQLAAILQNDSYLWNDVTL